MASKTENRRVNIWINGKAVENSGKAIRSEFHKARNELNKANKAAGDYQAKLRRFKQADGALKKHNKELRGVSRGWQQFKTIVGGVLGANLIQGALSRLGQFAKKLIASNAKLSDSYADVQKFTGLTRVEVEKLSKELDGFNTRTPRSELLNLAKVAGRIGIEGVDNIKDFVKQANQINVALGEDLGEDAVLQIGKIASAFKTDMLKIGSAINSAGQNSKAQEQFLVDFTARMQGTGVTAGIAAPEIIGYGAVLDSLGLKVEMSGTALNTFFIDFVKDTEKFGEAAGMANGELSKLIGEKGTNEGFLTFVQRLKEGSTGTTDFLQKLDKVGVSGARGSQVFLALSNNLDEVRKMQGLSNDAFEKGTSITDEYNIRNENLAANLEKVQNWMSRMFTNSAVMRGAERWVNLFSDWVAIPLSDSLQEEVIDLRALELQIYNTNTPADERIKLIKDLQENYPDYLGNIDAETVSNDDLRKSLDALNESLVYKLQLQLKEEEIDKKATAIAKNKNNVLAMERDLREQMAAAERKYGVSVNENLSLMEQSADIRKQLQDKEVGGSFSEFFFGTEEDSLEDLERNIATIKSFAEGKQTEMFNDLQEQRKELLKDRPPVDPSGFYDPNADYSKKGEGTDLGTPGETDEQKKAREADEKALEKKHEQFLKAEAKLQKDLEDLRIQNIADEEQRKIEKAKIDYERRQQEIAASVAKEATKNQLLVEEKYAFNNQIDAITEEYRLKRDEKQTEIDEQDDVEKQLLDDALMNERELEIKAVEEHYDDLIKLARKHGADVAGLEEKKAREVAGINKEYNDDAIQLALDAQNKKFEDTKLIAGQTTGALLSIMSLMGTSAEQMNDFQKASALFQIGINLAQGLSAAALAGAGDKYNSVTFGASGLATFATVTGMLLPAIAQAKSIIGSENKPKFNAPRSAPRYGKGTRFGGVTHDTIYGGNPIVDPRNGNVLGSVEKNETLLSARTSAANGPVVDALLASSQAGGDELDLLPYAMAQNQASVDFDGFGDGSSFGGGSGGESVEVIASMIAQAMAPALDEIRKIKQQPSVVKLSQLKDAERQLDKVQYLSGKKFNRN